MNTYPHTDDRLARARTLYEHAVFGGDSGALATADRELDTVEADLALARGRLLHARYLEDGSTAGGLACFERAAELYAALGDLRGEAEALFWVGTHHQVVGGDEAVVVPSLERSAELATRVGDKLTLSYALRHLGFAAHAAGRLDAARAQLEESVRLRREVGFLPGVAANLIGLAYLAAEQERRDEALALLDEATATAESAGAHGVLRWVEEARAEI